MKKTLFVLSLIGASATLMAQENTQTTTDDGRIAAKDLIGAVTTPALPIKQTYVPDEVMDRVTGTYGDQLYSIKQVKSGSGENVYQVTLINNSQSTVAWVGESGSEVAYVYRTDNDEMMAGTNNASNNNNTSNTTTADPNATTAPSVDDNTNSAPVNTLDNTGNTLSDETPDNNSPETLTPEENTGTPNEPTGTEMPNSEGTLPNNNMNNTNTNTGTSRPDGEQ